MSRPLLRIELRTERDIVLARQRARTVAGLLGFDATGQTRISTAVSEIARNAFQYGGGGEVELAVAGEGPPQTFVVRVTDRGPGIADLDAVLEGSYHSRTGMGLGLVGARRLMDSFQVESAAGTGTTVLLGKALPAGAPVVDAPARARIAEELLRQSPQSPFEEVQLQNQELLRALDDLRQRQEELQALNQELQDTNRGIMALYAELDDASAHLRRANELKGRFVSHVSHEFRTPLAAILALSRLLLDRVDGELTPEQEKQAAFIRQAAQDLATLVNDLLDLAKIEAGRVEVHPAEFEVAAMFSALRGMLKPLAASPAVTLEVEAPVGVPRLHTDEGKVSQILRNLVSNALKFTERGEVRVTARPAAGGTSVVFAVHDTGIGLASEDLERIFDAYSQVDTPLQGRVRGTGLGLPLSRQLAQLLGGELAVTSTLGRGSVFAATIPVRYAPTVAAAHPAPGPPDRTRWQVLVVDDDDGTQATYAALLKGSGFEVRPARDVDDARRQLAAARPAAIVLDVLLPGGNGWDFLTELKSSDATRDLPVFVATALQDARRAATLGAADFTTKPVPRAWLLDRLHAAAARGPLEKVLIIDDDEVARYLLQALLKDTRYTVLEAASGAEGLRLAAAEQPRLIFLDLTMPGMDGFETLERLKAAPRTAGIPVIVMTGKVLDDDERRTLTARVVAVLAKESTSREAAVAEIRAAVAKLERQP